MIAGTVVPEVPVDIKSMVLPVGTVKVPVSVRTVPLPVMVRVFEPLSENVCKESMSALVIVTLPPRLSVVLPPLADICIAPKSWSAVLTVSVWVVPPPVSNMTVPFPLVIAAPEVITRFPRILKLLPGIV